MRHVVVHERAFADRVVETVLHREVPVVTTQVVPVERVRVHVETVTDQVRVSEELASERIDVDVPGSARRATASVNRVAGGWTAPTRTSGESGQER